VNLYRDEGVVLRTQKLGEADRIVTLLTRENGQVRAVAKGVRRTRSKFGARLEPFMLVDVQLHRGRSLDIVTQAETLSPYGERIATDYPRYTAGTVMLETAERLSEEGEPALQQFLLLVGALRTLADGAHAPTLVLDAFLLRSLAVAGWAPSFVDCAVTGAPGPHTAFVVQLGGVVAEEAVDAVADDLGEPADAPGQDRGSAGEGLAGGVGPAFSGAGHHEEIGGGVPLGEDLVLDRAGEEDAIG